MRLISLHSNPNVTSSDSPSNAPIPAPTAVPILDEHEEDDDDEEEVVGVERELNVGTDAVLVAAIVAGAVAVAVRVPGMVSVLLGDFEPDVRL